jgi:hypothetical protein
VRVAQRSGSFSACGACLTAVGEGEPCGEAAQTACEPGLRCDATSSVCAAQEQDVRLGSLALGEGRMELERQRGEKTDPGLMLGLSGLGLFLLGTQNPELPSVLTIV